MPEPVENSARRWLQEISSDLDLDEILNAMSPDDAQQELEDMGIATLSFSEEMYKNIRKRLENSRPQENKKRDINRKAVKRQRRLSGTQIWKKSMSLLFIACLFPSLGLVWVMGYHVGQNEHLACTSPVCSSLDNSTWKMTSEYTDGSGSTIVSSGYLKMYVDKEGIAGTGTLEFSIDSTIVHRTIELSGGQVLHGRNIHLSYRLKETPKAKGIFILDLSEDETQFTGYAVGYEPRSSTVSTAVIRFEKLKPPDPTPNGS